jgi:hypothetical protein
MPSTILKNLERSAKGCGTRCRAMTYRVSRTTKPLYIRAVVAADILPNLGELLWLLLGTLARVPVPF